MKLGFFAGSVIAAAILTATTAYAYDITSLRNTPVSNAPATLQAEGFKFVGNYTDSDGDWKMWFNRRTGECVGYTQKGREVKRAKSFNNDKCRGADRGGFGDRHDGDDHYGPPPPPPGYGDRGGHDDRYGDNGDVPRWMVGSFRGYNKAYGAVVSLDISRDGSVSATVNGKPSSGEYRNGKLRMGFLKFTVDRDDDGFTTRQIGDDSNVVHYRRR
jgi:hypothetical protein